MADIERHSEETRKVVITQEDVKNIDEFFSHFQIEMPVHLRRVIDDWKKKGKDVTFEDQKRLRAFVANAIITVDHPLLRDTVFANIRKLCDSAWFEEQFHLDLEDALSQPSSSGSEPAT